MVVVRARHPVTPKNGSTTDFADGTGRKVWPKGRYFFWQGIFVICFFGLFGVIWYAYPAHFYAQGAEVSAGTVSTLQHQPSDEVLAEIADQYVGWQIYNPPGDGPVESSDQLLGQVRLPQATLSLAPFRPEDIKFLPQPWQLIYYGFYVPRVYLIAYEQTGDSKYLEAARDFILAWIDYDRQLWNPENFAWNDHAIAMRSEVLVQFWRAYRRSTAFSMSDAQRILRLATKNAALLSDPTLYTFATNHGVMQNLALIQLKIALPAIPELRSAGDLAYARLQTQLPRYVNEEGAILEHSAGYQAFGVHLLGAVLRDLSLLKKTIPTEWRARYRKAIGIYSILRRPDGSLPAWGDTARNNPNSQPQISAPSGDDFASLASSSDWRPVQPTLIAPGAGFAVAWSAPDRWPERETLSQTLVSWSYFPGFAHKKPDELETLIWADGQNWWTAEGYLSDQPSGWGVSNAPHIADEAISSVRQSQLLGSIRASDVFALDLERKTADGFAVRRQIVAYGGSLWVVFDTAMDVRDRKVQTVWLTDANIYPARRPVGSNVRLTARESSHELDVTFLGGPDLRMSMVSGSGQSPIGWVERNRAGVSSFAFLLEQPSRSAWSANISRLVHKGDDVSQPSFVERKDPEHWRVVIPMVQGAVTIERQAKSLTVMSGDKIAVQAPFEAAAGAADSKARSLRLFAEDASRYPVRVRDDWPYRVKASVFTFGLLVAQTLLFLLTARLSPMVRHLFCAGSVTAYAGLALWFALVYF